MREYRRIVHGAEMTPAEFMAIGKRLYGYHWRRCVADCCGVSIGMVHKYARPSGRYPVPAPIAMLLRLLLHAHGCGPLVWRQTLDAMYRVAQPGESNWYAAGLNMQRRGPAAKRRKQRPPGWMPPRPRILERTKHG